MGSIRELYPVVFEGGGSNKPHSKAYRDFKQKWSFISVVYDFAEKKIEKIEKVNATYLSDFLQLLTYVIEEGDMDEQEQKFQDDLRRAKKGR